MAFKIRQNPFSVRAHDAPPGPDPLVGWRGDTPFHTYPTRHRPTFGPRHASPMNSSHVCVVCIKQRLSGPAMRRRSVVSVILAPSSTGVIIHLPVCLTCHGTSYSVMRCTSFCQTKRAAVCTAASQAPWI